MSRIFLLLICLIKLSISFGQNVQTVYYEDIYLTKKTNIKKALYIKTTTTNAGGEVIVNVIRAKDKETILREMYKDNEPVGKWLNTSPYGRMQTLDYDFKLSYTDKFCAEDASYINFKTLKVLPFVDNDSLQYVCPKLSTKERSLTIFVNKRIVYPRAAIENEISGTVLLQLIIDTDGKVDDILVKQGVNKMLDKEAMRIVRAMEFTNGASINGVKKKICAALPIRFLIEG